MIKGAVRGKSTAMVFRTFDDWVGSRIKRLDPVPYFCRVVPRRRRRQLSLLLLLRPFVYKRLYSKTGCGWLCVETFSGKCATALRALATRVRDRARARGGDTVDGVRSTETAASSIAS